nr:hypothetical protein B0A51_16498 [Rachicladosporium sp. CCFEE 5018]
MSGSRAVDFATWIDVEASSTVDALHEEESAGNKEKRHQGKQACQQCRRRKIKCDETRPKCKSCGKAKLTCEYELPAGQTRQQALVENQSKIQHELEAHASLISTLRTLPSDAAVEVLNRLREGQYDGILVGGRESRDGTEVQQGSFPWEYPVDNAEEDASGEGGEAYSDATASLPQSYTQSVGHNMDFFSSQQSTQVATMPFTAMPRVEQNLPYPGYYAPCTAYQTPSGRQRSLSMGVPAEQLQAGEMEISQQVSQQFHMAPPAGESHIATDQRSKRAPRQ